MSEVKRIKPSLSKGTRDFLPAEVAKRNYIFDTIKGVFRKYGFEEIETPAIERLETLTGKYGEEGDKLLFKILNSGDYLEKTRTNKELVRRISSIQSNLEDVLKSLFQATISNRDHWLAMDNEVFRNTFKANLNHEIFNWDLYLLPDDKSTIVNFLNKNADAVADSLHNAFRRSQVSPESFEDNFNHYFRIFRDLVLSETILPQVLDVKQITGEISEKGLRYDLTVPLARYVVQHQDDLAFPFKRFHIGPVWRADRPQKGRYQEFYQCDADIIGSDSLLNEVELTRIYAEVFKKLGVRVTIRINSRKILEGLSFLFLQNLNEDVINRQSSSQKFEDFVTTLDKLDKIGQKGVNEELISKGYDSQNVMMLNDFLTRINEISSASQRLMAFQNHAHFDASTPFGNIRKTVDELGQVFHLLEDIENVEFDLTLARGLNYYTGIVWEIEPVIDFVNEGRIGSLGGGGRYDKLTEMFGAKNMTGVGISFGIERIYDIMIQRDLFPETISQGVKVLFVPRDQSAEQFTFQQVQTLRDQGIPAEIFLGNVKKQKQFNYAEQKNISYLVEVGENEQNTGLFRLRNAKTRETHNDLTLQDIISRL